MSANTARVHATILRLLRAVGGEVDPLVERLTADVGPQGPDSDTARLLSVVFPSLRRSRAGALLRDQARKAYLGNWVVNRSLLMTVAPVVEALRAAGCRPVALKGVALLVSQYRNLGLRRGGDLDVLVDPRHAETAWRILEDLGGLPEQRGVPTGASSIRSAHHAWHFDLGGRATVDLHWSPFSDCCSLAAADRFLTTAREAVFSDFAFSVPSPENLLLHACAHGAHRDWWVPGRWLVDAATIVAATPALDWALVWEGAREAGLEHAIDAALRDLDAKTGLPSGWDAGRRGRHASPWDRLELWAWRRDELSFAKAPIPRLISHVSRYRRLRRFHPDWTRQGVGAYWRLYRLENNRATRRR